MAVLNFIGTALQLIASTTLVLIVIGGVMGVWTALFSKPEVRKRRLEKWNGKKK